MASGWLDETEEEFAGLTDSELVEVRRCALDEIGRLRPTREEVRSAVPDRALDLFSGPPGDLDSKYLWKCLFNFRDKSVETPESVATWEELSNKHDSYLMQVRRRERVEAQMEGRMRERLRPSRLALGMSLKEVAKLAGTHSKHVDEVEQSRAKPRAAWFFEQACTVGASIPSKLPLNLRLWLPLVDSRLCRTIREVVIDPAWLVARDEVVLALARRIREERSFDRLPELGMILEKVGCDDAEILDHCRNPGLHAAGCWVVDALVRAGRSA